MLRTKRGVSSVGLPNDLHIHIYIYVVTTYKIIYSYITVEVAYLCQ